MSTRVPKAKVGRRSTLILHRTTSKKGHEGFDDLKESVKSGEEFCKEVSAVLQERADLDLAYSRTLMKLSSKLLRASKERSGTVSNAWYFVANDFEQTAEIHKNIAATLTEEIGKPLKNFLENEYKTRKSIESGVEKRNKQLTEWKSTQAKAKAKSYLACRENEKVQDQMLDCKLGRGRHLSDKENVKLETKRKKSESSVRKGDMEYYASSIKTERSRLDWECSIFRGSSGLRRLEQERLEQLADKATQYLNVMKENRPKLANLTCQLEEPVRLCDTHRDIDAVAFDTRHQEGMGEQLLPSFYSEDLINVMNKERRRESLSKLVGILKADIERERKGKAGVENLAKALQETPKFGGEDSQQDVQDKLQHMQAMLTYLEATRFKILNVMLDLEGKQRVSHPMAAYLDNIKDKQGLSQSILRVPSWFVADSQQVPLEWEDRGTADGGAESWSSPANSPHSRSPHLVTSVGVFGDSSPAFTTTNPIHGRGRADGGFVDETGYGKEDPPAESPLSDSDFDEFDSNEEDVVSFEEKNSQDNEIHEIYYQEKQVAVIGQCRALYDYTANMYDELNIRVGDVINVHDKQEDGWWLGECSGKVGIFPATYVESL